MTSIKQMLESVFSGKLNESKDSFKNVISEKIAAKLKAKKQEMYKSSCNETTLDENKLADVMDTVRHHIGPVTKDSNISAELKAKAAKEVSKEHGISSTAANKFVGDYCKSCNERYDSDLDANKNGKLDADDFKKLRAKKKEKECDHECKEALDIDSELDSILDEARFEKGEDIGKPNTGKDTGFKNLADKAAKEYGSKESGKKVAGAILKKILAKKGK